jgi:hypothetical protein
MDDPAEPVHHAICAHSKPYRCYDREADGTVAHFHATSGHRHAHAHAPRHGLRPSFLTDAVDDADSAITDLEPDAGPDTSADP